MARKIKMQISSSTEAQLKEASDMIFHCKIHYDNNGRIVVVFVSVSA